jgi:hypothetical protein
MENKIKKWVFTVGNLIIEIDLNKSFI